MCVLNAKFYLHGQVVYSFVANSCVTDYFVFSFTVQKLTGGTLLLRNKYYIVIYRGRDFVPTSVAAVIAERQEMTKHVQHVEEKVRCKVHDVAPSREDESKSQAGSLAEFFEAQACWGRDISTEERERMRQEVTKAKNDKLAKKNDCKLAVVSIYLFCEGYMLGKVIVLY